MSPNHTTPVLVQCDACGMYRHVGHPIDACHRCEPDKHEAQFAAMRKRSVWVHVLGHDIYSDRFYFERDGVVFEVGASFMRCMPGRVPDAVVAELTKLKTENVEVLAENARLRRRLENK